MVDGFMDGFVGMMLIASVIGAYAFAAVAIWAHRQTTSSACLASACGAAALTVASAVAKVWL